MPQLGQPCVYAGDDTLFRLITLGSVELQKQGFSPVKHETVPGPRPPFGGIIKTSDDLWRIIAFIRSVDPGSLKLRTGESLWGIGQRGNRLQPCTGYRL